VLSVQAPAAALDRVAPSRREACTTRTSGRQTWKELLFLHWEVPAARLRALVPPALEIDTFDGRAFVGLVPFTMTGVRLGPIAVADFREVNLRTYVHAGGVPGVWFFSLDAESTLAVWGARALYRLPYHRARFDGTVHVNATACAFERDGAGEVSLDVQWTPTGTDVHHAAPGTLEHFLTERYALYGPTRSGSVYRVRVHHPPWPLRPARVERFASSVLEAARVEGGAPVDLVLASVDGVSVETFAKERV
jgi:uncharacterized protein YqjF (DUF2071 family)